MDIAVPREKALFKFNLILAIIIWSVLILCTFGLALIYLLLGYIFFLFVHSALIAHMKGNAVLITSEQFPDLFAKIENASKKLTMKTPRAYLMNGNGIFNAFATRFLRQNYIVLLSSVVDSFEADDAPIDFYIGHELGHIHRNHLRWWPLFAPLGMFPLLWPAYRRACEFTCDQYGKFCSPSLETAAQGLGLLAAGGTRWKTLSSTQFMGQNKETGGFWMSFHELTGTYPWLSKRMAMLQGNVVDVRQSFPKRNKFAYVVGLFCPGFLSGAFMPIIYLYIAVIVSVVAIPQFTKYQAKAKTAASGAQMPGAKQWTNPINGKILNLPGEFLSIPPLNSSKEVIGTFTTNPDLMAEQIQVEKLPRKMVLEEYVRLYKQAKETVTKAPIQDPEISNYNGVEVAEFLVNSPTTEAGVTFNNLSRLWTHDGIHFWILISTQQATDTKTHADSKMFLDFLVSNTL